MIVCKFCLNGTYIDPSQFDSFSFLEESDESLSGFKQQLYKYKTKCSYVNEDIILIHYNNNESFLSLKGDISFKYMEPAADNERKMKEMEATMLIFSDSLEPGIFYIMGKILLSLWSLRGTKK